MPHCCTDPVLSYETLFRTAKKLWDEGKIDIAFVRSTNSLKRYEDAHIPYLYIFPDDNTIADSIRSAVSTAKLRLNSVVQKASILIRLVYPDNLAGIELEYQKVTLLKALMDFRKEQGVSFSVQTFVTYFQITWELEDGGQLPSLLRSLILYLNAHGEISFRLGAGLSASLSNSLEQAEQALNESVHYGKNDGFLINEQLRLMGPLSVQDPLHVSYDNEKILIFSKANGINEGNLQKIIGLFLKNPRQFLNSSLLSEWLNITPRSCNRIIQKLCLAGLLTQMHTEGPMEKGRPVKTYCFNEKACLSTFF
ncbi:hypothetical protein CLOM621_07322 [Clostridium sp. M62/1]|nr:hypothetical protein CLOM621_07322 [Clostridium sp. M62/1]